ncbi:MAG TPA: zinc ribbon domain-containing protein [Methanomassiliicoccales archaeon]|nr:zinc ribbon domain-containing protein [Methanomassiliicoccales archaeon]
MATCWNCGRLIPDDAAYCSYCGKPVNKTEAKPTQTTQAYPMPMREGGYEELRRQIKNTYNISLATLVLVVALIVLIFI